MMPTQTARKPWLAAFMSLVLPGYGQLYNGELNKGVMLFILFTLFSFPLLAAAALYTPPNIMLVAILLSSTITIGLWVYGIRDAYQYAKQQQTITCKAWQTPSFYLASFLIAMFFILPTTARYTRHYYVESFQIPSNSMEPSIMAGDILFVDKRYNCPRCKYSIQRGDIVVFFYPNDRTRYYIKRIIGLAGDTIEMHNKQLFINDKALHASSSTATTKQGDKQHIIEEKTEHTHYQTQWQLSDTSSLDTLIVPQGKVFVMGDNRSTSEDSRDFGAVPLDDVIGKARQVWFSWDKKAYRVRWGRLGKVLQ